MDWYPFRIFTHTHTHRDRERERAYQCLRRKPSCSKQKESPPLNGRLHKRNLALISNNSVLTHSDFMSAKPTLEIWGDILYDVSLVSCPIACTHCTLLVHTVREKPLKHNLLREKERQEMPARTRWKRWGIAQPLPHPLEPVFRSSLTRQQGLQPAGLWEAAAGKVISRRNWGCVAAMTELGGTERAAS